MEHLERHGSVVSEILGEVARGHTAAPDLALEDIPVAQGFGEERRVGCSHEGRQVAGTL
jgi:hypothetical protein